MVIAIVMAVATPAGAQQSSSRTTSPDSEFAMKAAQANMAEIELGKLAQKKATRDEVKQFAQRMVADHSKSLDELEVVVAGKKITLPTEINAEQKTLVNTLSKMNGAEFDRAYMRAMVDAHRKVAADVRTESQSGNDPELKSWAAKKLPTVEEHLEHAEKVNQFHGTAH